MKDSLDILDMVLPDYSGHPPPPQLSFEEYQRWVFEEIVPSLAREGKITPQSQIDDFMNNEGRMEEFRY